MADPVTILCSILTIADASKKILDVCTEYVAHARDAPKELQRVIEDVHALNGTMKRLDRLAKSARRTERNADQFDQWELPLNRIKKCSEDLVKLISQQDMKIGVFHELRFRSRWSHHWRGIDSLLRETGRLQSHLNLATSVYGAEMIGTLFEIVDERLPNALSIERQQSNPVSATAWRNVDLRDCSPGQRQAFILQKLGDLIGWHLATYEYPAFDNTHHLNVACSANYAKEHFLEYEAYQAWKTRRTRGPGLLCVTGHAMTGKTTLCCRVIQDLQGSNDSDIGVAYFYFGDENSSQVFSRALQSWIIQLASQCDSLPSEPLPADWSLKALNRPDLPTPLKDREAGESGLQKILESLIAKFRRTFFIIDGLDETSYIPDLKRMVRVLQNLLEQDFGNVSIAIFSRPTRSLEPLLQLADVSIKSTQLEYDLSDYVWFKVAQKVKPLLLAENFFHDEESLAVIRSVMIEASAGLYLGVDVLTDSLIATIRERGDVAAFLRQTRENNEIMLQRDPESMKQKAFGVETRTSSTGNVEPSKRAGQP